MTETAVFRGSVRDRLVVALADPEVARQAGRTSAALVAFHEPMAIFEWIGAGKGLVLLDHGGIPDDELRAQLERVLSAHEKGLLFIAVAGGGAEVAETLRTVDAAARNRDHLGFYHAEDGGQLKRVAGRRLPELEKAGRDLPEVAPLSPEAITAIAERGRQERLEAVAFVNSHARRFPQATLLLIGICFLLSAVTSSSDARARQIFDLLCNRPDGLQRWELWRLLSYAFLHDTHNPMHLIVNMLSLYSLGSFLEPMLGRRRMVLLYAATALAGGAASALFTRAVSVGASGAVWGLLGATFGLVGGKQRFFPALIARGLRQRLVVVLIINIILSFFPHIDRYCHFGGGLAGYLLARFYARGPGR